MIRAIFFDIGETLIDETRQWADWADWLHTPHLTFFALLGATIARGEHHRRVFDLLRPGFDLHTEQAARIAAGHDTTFTAHDLYPDVRPCLAALRTAGYQIGLVGNQPLRSEKALRALGLPADIIASSDGWGTQKPDPTFFAHIAQAAQLAPAQIAYVGDRLDNDILPAKTAGMTGIHLKRGPWGYLHAHHPDATQAHLRIDTLHELPDALHHYTRRA